MALATKTIVDANPTVDTGVAAPYPVVYWTLKVKYEFDDYSRIYSYVDDTVNIGVDPTTVPLSALLATLPADYDEHFDKLYNMQSSYTFNPDHIEQEDYDWTQNPP